MGAGASVASDASPEQIAEGISELGAAFAPYAQAVQENGLNGELLADYTSKNTTEELLNDLNITNQMHRKRLLMEVEKLRTTPVVKEDSQSRDVEPTHDGQLSELIEIAKKIEAKPLEKNVSVDDINHIFISYRQATETQLATRLYNGCKAIVADREFAVAGKKPKLFFR